MNYTKINFLNSLLDIYNLDVTSELIKFLHGEQAVLFHLKHHGKTIPSDISEKLSITKSRMTTIISSLVKKEMIEIKQDKTDFRKKNIKLTKKGLKEIDKIELEILKMFDYYIEKLGIEKLKNLTVLLNETVKIMEGNRND